MPSHAILNDLPTITFEPLHDRRVGNLEGHKEVARSRREPHEPCPLPDRNLVWFQVLPHLKAFREEEAPEGGFKANVGHIRPRPIMLPVNGNYRHHPATVRDHPFTLHVSAFDEPRADFRDPVGIRLAATKLTSFVPRLIPGKVCPLKDIDPFLRVPGYELIQIVKDRIFKELTV